MRVRSLHPWNVSPPEAMAIQLKLRGRVRLNGDGPFATVAGIDVSYDRVSNLMFAGVVVMSGDGKRVLEAVTATARPRFPYIPGLLSFRETPAVIGAWIKLKMRPDCLICDGHGFAHPRRFGLACHLGVLLDLPSIGCAKSLLVGTYQMPARRRGSVEPLVDREEQIGAVVRTRDGVAPVFVSQGHKINLAAAVKTILNAFGGCRLPEPTRRAHLLVNEARLRARSVKGPVAGRVRQ
jgi:deoxyribonuclease V